MAELAIQRMEEELKRGDALVTINEYIHVIEQYLISVLGKRSATNIDALALDELAEFDAERLGHKPSKSTELKHNAALNRVFDEAVIRGFLTEANRPKLTVSVSTGDRRPAFGVRDVAAVLKNFGEWIASAKSDASREQ